MNGGLTGLDFSIDLGVKYSMRTLFNLMQTKINKDVLEIWKKNIEEKFGRRKRNLWNVLYNMLNRLHSLFYMCNY